jgi:hypothetical protein
VRNPTDKVSADRFAQAVSSLSGDNNFKTILEWMKSNLDETDKDGRYLSDPVALHQNQGRAQVLTEIINTFRRPASAGSAG